MVTDVIKDMNTCEEFLEIIASSHVITAALQVLKQNQRVGKAFGPLTDILEQFESLRGNTCVRVTH